MTRPMIADCITATAYVTGISRERIIGREVTQDVFRARALACWLARKCGYSFQRIGDELDGRDHTTIMNAVGRGDDFNEWLPGFRQMIMRAIAFLLERRQ